jgi:hypothetical protein
LLPECQAWGRDALEGFDIVNFVIRNLLADLLSGDCFGAASTKRNGSVNARTGGDILPNLPVGRLGGIPGFAVALEHSSTLTCAAIQAWTSSLLDSP